MEIRDKMSVPAKRFDSGEARGIEARVLIGKANGATNFVMRHFEIAPGGYTPRHSHPWEHEIFIHAGKGAILKEGKWVNLKPGMAVFIPPNEEHQFKNRGNDSFVMICLIPAGNPEL